MESSVANPNTIEVIVDKKIPYVKESSKLLQLIEKFKETNPELYAIKEKVFLIAFISGSLFLLLKLFDITTLIYLTIIFSSITGFVIFKIYEIRKNGLLFYLSSNLKNLLAKRSIFDILMDLWYLPTISEYLMLIVKPFIYKLPPEEVPLILEDFDFSTRKFFLTKGIMNLFPEKIKKLMLPCKIEIEKFDDKETNNLQINNNNNICFDLNEENISGSTCCENKKIEEIKIENSKALKKSKSTEKLMSSNVILQRNKSSKTETSNKNRINEKKKSTIKNLNPNVLNIIQKKGFNLTKNINSDLTIRLLGSDEMKQDQNNGIVEEHKADEIKFSDGENKRKLSIAYKKNTSFPYLLKNQTKLTEANLEKSPTAFSRNSSNISILDYQLDKNNNDYFNKKHSNNLKNNYEIFELNPLMLSNSNLDLNFINGEKSFENNKFTTRNKASLPRSISYNKDLCVNIDREIYNTILLNIHNNLHKEHKENQILKSTSKDLCLKSISEPNQDQISDNSFRIKHEKTKSILSQDEDQINKIKKLKVNANNYSANINGYAPLVKKTEIKNNNIYNYYEYRDENNKKVVFKTKVLESSELLNKFEEEEQEILCFDGVYNNDSHVKELKNFQWDNLPAYIVKQEKLAKKQSMGIEPTKKLTFFSVFSNVVKDQIIRKIDSDKMKKAFAIFLVTLMIQLILSRKIRNWSLSFLQFCIFTATSLGFGGTLYFMLKKAEKSNNEQAKRE